MREPSEFEAPLCAEVGGDYWFPESSDTGANAVHNIAYAKKICFTCRHNTECAEWGIQNERFGIWGGLTEHQRKGIRRQRNIVLKEERSA